LIWSRVRSKPWYTSSPSYHKVSIFFNSPLLFLTHCNSDKISSPPQKRLSYHQQHEPSYFAMPSKLPTITAPASRLASCIEHFPQDHQYAYWNHRYGYRKPKNQRTFNAYRRRSKWLQSGANWLIKKVQVKPREGEFLMSGALPVEEHVVEGECGSMRYTVWSSVEASEIELGLT
jgi:hypothetical protein